MVMEKRLLTKFKKQIEEISFIWKDKCQKESRDLFWGSITMLFLTGGCFFTFYTLIDISYNLMDGVYFELFLIEAVFSGLIISCLIIISYRYKNIGKFGKIESSYWIYGIFWTIFALFILFNISDFYFINQVINNDKENADYFFMPSVIALYADAFYVLKGIIVLICLILLFKGVTLNLKLSDIKKTIWLSYKSGYKFIDFQLIQELKNMSKNDREFMILWKKKIRDFQNNN